MEYEQNKIKNLSRSRGLGNWKEIKQIIKEDAFHDPVCYFPTFPPIYKEFEER